MSIINEQIKRLREKADTFKRSGCAVDGIVKEFRQAADTIEELSAKLHNANTERSTAYYNNGWIPCSERLPEKNGQYLVTVKKGYMLLGLWCGIKDDWRNVIAWMPLPEPYKEGEE